jgi:hypothetical protein
VRPWAVDLWTTRQTAASCPQCPQPLRRRGGYLFDDQMGTFSIDKINSSSTNRAVSIKDVLGIEDHFEKW